MLTHMTPLNEFAQRAVDEFITQVNGSQPDQQGQKRLFRGHDHPGIVVPQNLAIKDPIGTPRHPQSTACHCGEQAGMMHGDEK
jgi:hypothetical protein